MQAVATDDFTLTKAFDGAEYSKRFEDLYEEGLATLARREATERRLDSFFAQRDAAASLWPTIQKQAAAAAASLPGVLAPLLQRSVTAHASLPEAAAALLASRVAGDGLSASALADALVPRLKGAEAALARDLLAVVETDPAAPDLLGVFLNFKGFHALAAHRAASALWAEEDDVGAKQLALLLQGRASAAFGVDIHPGATIGAGIFIDHASGVVIGEQAAVGDDCYILHGVTLGATGKVKHGRRHPHVGSGCTIGSGASVLGPISIGDGCTVGANAVVTKDLEAGATVIETGFMSNRVLKPRKR